MFSPARKSRLAFLVFLQPLNHAKLIFVGCVVVKEDYFDNTQVTRFISGKSTINLLLQKQRWTTWCHFLVLYTVGATEHSRCYLELVMPFAASLCCSVWEAELCYLIPAYTAACPITSRTQLSIMTFHIFRASNNWLKLKKNKENEPLNTHRCDNM